MIRRLVYIIMCAMTAVVNSSCEHKELCYQHPHKAVVRLEFDWRDAPSARPDGMCVFFYPAEGEDAPVRRFDFTGRTGGLLDIQTGRYRVLCYNNDTESVLFDGMGGFDTHMAFTREGSVLESVYGSQAAAPKARGAEDERVVISPDMMWGCTALDVEITENGVSYVCVPESEREEWAGKPVTTTEQVITLYPHELICTYTYEIRNVSGLEHVTQMCASLSGMAPSLLFATEELGRECVTIPFGAVKEGTTKVTGRFLTFGHHEANAEPHRMLLYVWTDDGSRYCYGCEGDKFDVTEQVHSAPDRRHVHLIIDGLDMPQPMTGDNGLAPSVDDWQEVNADIHI